MAPRTVGEIGEIELVERILTILGGGSAAPSDAPEGTRLVVGPGDDAAVLDAGGDVVVTTDSQHEGVHFERSWMSAEALGRRAIAVNASDVGAMGGEPLGFLAALALPGDTAASGVERLAAGLAAGAARWGGRVIGGDVARLEGRVSINVTAVGRMPPGVAPVRRSGAAEGDLCWISGRPGRAAAGRALLAAGYRLAGDRLELHEDLVRGRHGTASARHESPGTRNAGTTARDALPEDGDAAAEADPLAGGGDATAAAIRCIRAFIDPGPPVGLGAVLARDGLAAAMIDLSDGTGIDLRRLCEASGVGACLDADPLLAAPLLEALASALEGSAGPRKGRPGAAHEGSDARRKGRPGAARDRGGAGRGSGPGAGVERWVLAGGDDYQLLGAVTEGNREALVGAARRAGFEVRIVGRFTAAAEGLQLARDGVRKTLAAGGWDHFS
jgi:thiamine-monophosphate kinase